jgi:hypothetical protein
MDLDVGIRIEIKKAKTLHISSESKAEWYGRSWNRTICQIFFCSLEQQGV